ncbi:hypothetical protein GCM10020256_31340 [Streptomyces thermocoprophilus]
MQYDAHAPAAGRGAVGRCRRFPWPGGCPAPALLRRTAVFTLTITFLPTVGPAHLPQGTGSRTMTRSQSPAVIVPCVPHGSRICSVRRPPPCTGCSFWSRAQAFCASCGITVERILIDNGSC